MAGIKLYSNGTFQSTKFIQDGSGSIKFNNTSVNTSYLTTTNTGGFLTSGGPWCIEGWIYLTGYSNLYSTSFYTAVIASTAGAGTSGWSFLINGTASSWTGLGWQNGDGSLGTYCTYTFSLNTWYHVAVVATGTGAVQFYINGTLTGSVSAPIAFTENTTLYVGRQSITNFEYYFPGILTDFRIVNTVPVYTANFAVPTTKLTAITNTVLLLNAPDSWSNFLADSSTNNLTLSSFGSVVPTFSATSPVAKSSVPNISSAGVKMSQYSNSAMLIGNIVEVAGATPRLYANGTFVCPNFVEVP